MVDRVRSDIDTDEKWVLPRRIGVSFPAARRRTQPGAKTEKTLEGDLTSDDF